MRAYVDAFIEGESVSAKDMIVGLPESVQTRIDRLSALYKKLNGPDELKEVELFRDAVASAAGHYDLQCKGLNKWLESDYWLASIRADAFRSLKTLNRNQFMWSPTGGTGTPKIGKDLLEFWNIPHLIRWMRSQGVTGIRAIHLCLIRDPDAVTSSFFVVAVINGESLTVLSDKPNDDSPDKKFVRRRPGRDMARREAMHHFPYEVLVDGKFDLWAACGDEVEAAVKKSDEGSVARYTDGFLRRAPIKGLNASTSIWLIQLFDLVAESWITENRRLPELSYTVEMVRKPEMLTGGEDHHLVVSGAYSPLQASEFTIEDASIDATIDQWCKSSGQNEWMIERYGHLVPSSVLNVIGSADRKSLTSPGQGRYEKAVDDYRASRGLTERFPSSLINRYIQEGIEVGEISVPGDTLGDKAVSRLTMAGVRWRSVSPVQFGTAKEIEEDRQHSARSNLCMVVNDLARDEHRRTSRKILNVRILKTGQVRYSGYVWRKLQPRIDWVLDCVAAGSMVFTGKHAILNGFANPTYPDNHPFEMMRWALIDGGLYGGERLLSNAHFGQMLIGPKDAIGISRWSNLAGAFICPDDDVKASVHAIINMTGPDCIAWVLDVPVSSLPWQLKRWVPNNDMSRFGNHLLNRTDPADHLLKNPWCGRTRSRRTGGMPLMIHIAMSLRAINRRRKAMGLPRRDWSVRGVVKP